MIKKKKLPRLSISMSNGTLTFSHYDKSRVLPKTPTTDEIYEIKNLKRRLSKLSREELIELVSENFFEDKYHINLRKQIALSIVKAHCPYCGGELLDVTVFCGDAVGLCPECRVSFVISSTTTVLSELTDNDIECIPISMDFMEDIEPLREAIISSKHFVKSSSELSDD